MAKLPNRLVIEITNTDQVDELGNPVIGFESKDYAKCIIEELEKIKVEINKCPIEVDYPDIFINQEYVYKILNKHISELKGENK